VTDSPGSGHIEGLVEQLALTFTLCDATDLGELAKMHAQMAELVRLVEDCADLVGAAAFCTFGSSLGLLLEGVVLESYSDLDKILETIRKAIAEIQTALKSGPGSAPVPQDETFVQEVIPMAKGDAILSDRPWDPGEQATETPQQATAQGGEPVMHMVRNSVDHGIELAAGRAAAGKPERGSVHLHAAHVGGNIVIEITDNGQGLDRDKLILDASGLVAMHNSHRAA